MADKTLAQVIIEHQAGKLDVAEAGYRAILKNSPDNADAIHLLGVICFQRQQFDAARELVLRAISLKQTDALYYANLGRIEKAHGAVRPAISAYRKSLELAPDQAEVNSDIAAALVDVDEYAEALMFARRAIKNNPNFAAAFLNKGLAHSGLGDSGAAIKALSGAVQLDAGFADAWFQLARHYQNDEQFPKAEQAYRQALSIDPERIEALCNLGNILRYGGRLDEALQCYDQALGKSTKLGEVYSNKGVTLHELGRRTEAIECYRQAIELTPDDAEAHRNLSMALLQGEEFAEGWQEFEWRWQTRHFSQIRRDWGKPQWSGESLVGKTILIHAEQGFGDSFQFCRYLPMLAERGGRIIVEAPEVVQAVLGTVTDVDYFVTPGQALPDYDFQIPMMSLPGAFRTSKNSIPVSPSYLSVPTDAAVAWAGKIDNLARRRIGIVWKGNSEYSRNLWRSPGLEAMRPLFTQEQCTFISLQKDDGTEDLSAAGLTDKLVDLENGLKSFSDTAAVIGQLDLVITPDTSVAHLSAAMGCPTWVMLPHVAEWRWGIGRDDCPWYPSMRLFRQFEQGDWEGVVQHLVEELGCT